MKGKGKTARPTQSELEILGILWESGPVTVRQVNDRLNETRPVGYTTTLKLLQIMFEKGLVGRDESQRSHLYTAAVRETDTQRQLLDRMVDTIFGGSAAKLVMKVLGDHRASNEEIDQIRNLLDRMNGESDERAR